MLTHINLSESSANRAMAEIESALDSPLGSTERQRLNHDTSDWGRHPDGSSSNRAYQHKRAKMGQETVPKLPLDLPSSIPARFVTIEGNEVGPSLDLPVIATQDKLEKLINQLSANKKDGDVPYAFYIQDKEVTGTIAEMIAELGLSTEASLTVSALAYAYLR